MLGVLRFGLVGGFPDEHGAGAGVVAVTYQEGMGAASGRCAAAPHCGGTRSGAVADGDEC